MEKPADGRVDHVLVMMQAGSYQRQLVYGASDDPTWSPDGSEGLLGVPLDGTSHSLIYELGRQPDVVTVR